MNFKNLAENLIIVIVSALLGAAIGYYASTESNRTTIELLTPTIREAIARETTSIKNEITHDIQVRIDKLKKSDSLNININQNPETKQTPTNKITVKRDTVKPKPERKGFFRRLFSKNNE